MAWSLPGELVVRGVIDNTRKGIVDVELWLVGKSEPLRLKLSGHPLADVVGCRVEFIRRSAAADESLLEAVSDLVMTQQGACGDITASQKRRIEGEKRGEVLGFENMVYVEWYTPEKGRCVFQSGDMDITMGEPQWEMTAEDKRQAAEASAAVIQGFVDGISGERVEVKDGEMDEFEWEEFLKERDRRADALGELLEKFGHDERGWDEAAKYMGWNTGDDTADEEDADDEAEEPEPEWKPEEPDQEDEDTDESGDNEDVFAEYDRRENAITKRVAALLDKIRKPLGSESTEARDDFEFHLMKLGAKLAGALNSLEDGGPNPERGMTIALLKRTVVIVGEAIALFDAAEVPQDQRAEVFAIRQDILDRITSLRQDES
jgi:hypothetical protein